MKSPDLIPILIFLFVIGIVVFIAIRGLNPFRRVGLDPQITPTVEPSPSPNPISTPTPTIITITPTPTENTIGVLNNTEQISLFTQALKLTGVYDVLISMKGPYTVFAPTNESMQNYIGSTKGGQINELDTAVLNEFVKNHVSYGNYLQSEINNTVSLSNNSLNINQNEPTVNGIKIVRSISATNGTVNIVEGVLVK